MDGSTLSSWKSIVSTRIVRRSIASGSPSPDLERDEVAMVGGVLVLCSVAAAAAI